MVKGELGATCPGEYTFINKGIGGNRIVDVYARIKVDTINLRPDYMSLLIGCRMVFILPLWVIGSLRMNGSRPLKK